MQLNPDCIRDILLECEERCSYGKETVFVRGQSLTRGKRTYDNEELFYHVNQCNYAGYLVGASRKVTGDLCISDLSPKGHEFLANIREDTIWGSVKGIAGKIGVKSVNSLTQIASSVASELIIAYLRANGIAF